MARYVLELHAGLRQVPAIARALGRVGTFKSTRSARDSTANVGSEPGDGRWAMGEVGAEGLVSAALSAG